jgi:hypothetical protein
MRLLQSALSLLAISALATSCQNVTATKKPLREATIRQNIVGTWSTAENPEWAIYHLLTIRSDGSFATLRTNNPNWDQTFTAFHTNRVCEGFWRVSQGFLMLSNNMSLPNWF